MKPGAGLGFRRDLVSYFLDGNHSAPAFIELAPENWMNIGGYWRKQLAAVAERYPMCCHGLSLSLGSPDPIDWEHVRQIKAFLDEHHVTLYTEHLSFSKCDNAHLYDLLPIPFCEEAVKHVARRIREIQDFLERKIAIENVSYYTPIAPQMSEVEFVSAVAEEANCNLLLDINNVYVNAFNHKYDAKTFIEELPLERVAHIHMAGHEQHSETLIIDTHGQPIIEPVYDLFAWTLPKVNPVTVLLERDYNFGDLEQLESEVRQIETIMENHWSIKHAA